MQWALLEGATLFNGIAYFLVGNYAFIALAAVIILLFAMQEHQIKQKWQFNWLYC